MENYIKIINMIDDIAKNQRSVTEHEICIMNELARESGEDIKDYIHDLADANDCGVCNTWEEVINAFKNLWKNGERVEVKTTSKTN